MSTTHPFVTVAHLQRVLMGLQPDDVIGTRTKANTGNLPILRGGTQIGFIDVYEDRTRVEWLPGHDPEEEGDGEEAKGEGAPDRAGD